MAKYMEFAGGPFGQVTVDRAAQVRDAGGKVFYVNPNVGSSAEDRNTPFPEVDEETCFSTHQKAIDACAADRGDLIIVARGYEAVTATVNFNKQGISMIPQTFGLNPRHMGEYFCIDFSTTTTEPAAVISKACYIQGLGFHTGWAAAGSYQVQMGDGTGGGVWAAHLKNCRFTDWGTGCDYGLRFRASSNCLVDHCSFEGNLDAGVRFVGGINFWTTATNNPTNNQISNCNFNYCTYSIVHTASVNHQGLRYGPGNYTTESGTKFLNSDSGRGSGIIFGNYFNTAVGTDTNDLSVDDLETAGIICAGNYYADEERDDE